jgi:hypothetical protein
MPSSDRNPVLQDPATGDYVKYNAPAWGNSPYKDLTLPSGAHVQVKAVDLAAIIAADLVDEMDALSPVVEEKVVNPTKGKRPSDRPKKKPTKAQAKAEEAKAASDFMRSGEMLPMLNMMSRLTPFIVVQPKVLTHLRKNEAGEWEEIPGDERIEGSIYTDTIPLPDQMELFAFAMGGMDMEGLKQFREQRDEDLGDVAPVPVREDPPL